VTVNDIRDAASCLALEDGRASLPAQLARSHTAASLSYTLAPERTYAPVKLAPVEVPLPPAAAAASKDNPHFVVSAPAGVSNPNASFLKRVADKLGLSYGS
jgi:hypothetical protein